MAKDGIDWIKAGKERLQNFWPVHEFGILMNQCGWWFVFLAGFEKRPSTSVGSWDYLTCALRLWMAWVVDCRRDQSLLLHTAWDFSVPCDQESR